MRFKSHADRANARGEEVGLLALHSFALQKLML